MIGKLLICAQFILSVLIPLAVSAQNQDVQEDVEAVQSAHDLFYIRKYSEAIAAYQPLLKTPLRPNTRDAIRINMGRCYVHLGEDALAAQTFRAIIDDNPSGSYASQAVHQIGNLYIQRYQYKEAIRSCNELVQKYPNTHAAEIARYLIAQYMNSGGMVDKAIQNYRGFLKDYPNSVYHVSALHSLVRLYLARNRHDEAHELLQDYLRQNSGDTDLMEQLADLYKQQGKHSEALSLYHAALKHNPNDINLLKKIGELHAERGERNQAVHEWSKIIERGSIQPHRYQQLGEIYVSHQMYDEAIEVYQTALKRDTTSVSLYTNLADVYKIQGQIENAINTYLRALNAVDIGYSSRDRLIVNIAEIYEGEQQARLFAKIVARLKTELRKSPQNPKLVLALGEIYFHQGNLDLALESFARIHQVYPPDRGRFLEKYAHILDRQKHPKAVDYYETIILLFPDSVLAWTSKMKLARIYVQTARWQNALAVLNQMTRRHEDVNTLLLLGHVWLHGVRDVASAMRTYQSLISQPLTSAQQTEVQLRLAECHILQGQHDLAQNVLGPIAGGHGKFQAEAQKLIGDSLLFQERFEDAVTAYNNVLEVAAFHPASNDALDRIVLINSNSDFNREPLKRYVKALHAYMIGKTEKALEQGAETIDLYPQALIIDEMRLLFGDIYLKQGDHTSAIEAYHQVVTFESPRAPEAQSKIADTYRWELGDVRKAIQVYSALIDSHPESVVVAYARQQIDEMQKMLSE